MGIKSPMKRVILLLMLAMFSGSASSSDSIDYTKPESVALAFLTAAQAGKYELVPPMVMPKWQHRFTPEALKKAFSKIVLPKKIKLETSYEETGKKALVRVLGTKIGLELNLIEGKWLLEF